MNKLISIIIPVKNGEKYIKETIKAAQKQGLDIEIIVVNDASTDNTEQIAKDLGCKIINHPVCIGQVAGKNTGLRSAKGEYIMFLDADDVMNENDLKTLYDEMENDNSISAVMGKIRDFFSPELSEEQKQKTVIKKEPYYGLFSGAVLIRKSVFDKIGFFNEAIKSGEIIEWQNKMDKNNFKIKKIDFVSTNRRIHNSNFGRTNAMDEYKGYLTALREKLRG